MSWFCCRFGPTLTIEWEVLGSIISRLHCYIRTQRFVQVLGETLNNIVGMIVPFNLHLFFFSLLLSSPTLLFACLTPPFRRFSNLPTLRLLL